jgi:hypothetical protein
VTELGWGKAGGVMQRWERHRVVDRWISLPHAGAVRVEDAIESCLKKRRRLKAATEPGAGQGGRRGGRRDATTGASSCCRSVDYHLRWLELGVRVVGGGER